MQHAAQLTPVPSAACRSGHARRQNTYATTRSAAHILGALLLLSALAVSIASIVSQPQAPIPASWSTVSVGEDATLWAIAQAHPVAGRSTLDTVNLICAENRLADGTIHAGQVLRVPGREATVTLAQN